MPTKIPQVPKYRHYKPKDLAVVRIDGRDFYLGKYGSDESKEKYRRLVAELLTAPPSNPAPSSPPGGNPELSLTQLAIAYCDRLVVTY
jgi:hypothetical protein